MEFRVEHVVRGVDRPTYEKLFFDESLNVEMCKRLQLRRELRERRCDGDHFRRETEMEIVQRIPAWIRKFVGSRKLTYRETMTYVFARAEGAAAWRITPRLFASQIECTGTVDFLPHPQGIMQRVEGRVNIHIPLLGPYMERVAVREIQASFDKAADLTAAWLAAHPDATTQEAVNDR